MGFRAPAALAGVAVWVLRIAGSGAAPLAQEPIAIHVNDPRPVAAAVTSVEKRFGQIVTYEDTSYVHPSDIVDVTDRVSRDPDKTKRVFGMRWGAIDLTFTPPSADRDRTARALLQAIVDGSKAAGNTGDFAVLSRPGAFHVVPVARKGMSGALEPYASPLEARLTMPYREESGAAFMQRFTGAISAALRRPVWPNAPANLFAQKRVAIEAQNEKARDVLWRALQSMQEGLSWRMLCDVGEHGQCAINIHSVRRW